MLEQGREMRERPMSNCAREFEWGFFFLFLRKMRANQRMTYNFKIDVQLFLKHLKIKDFQFQQLESTFANTTPNVLRGNRAFSRDAPRLLVKLIG